MIPEEQKKQQLAKAKQLLEQASKNAFGDAKKLDEFMNPIIRFIEE
jgi:hypothetical protein